MLRKCPKGDPNCVGIQLFPNAGGGFGFGRTQSTTLPEGYDRTVNMTVKRGRTLTPSPEPKDGYFSALDTLRAGGIAAWSDATDTPFVVMASGAGGLLIQGWSAASSESVANTGDFYSLEFHDSAGTAYLYAGAGTVGTGAPNLLNRRTQAGVWTQDDDVNAKFIVPAAGALWRSTSDYQVSKCPAGSPPFTLASWGADVQCGTAYAKITSMGAIGAAPVVGKEDGIWVYNEADARFENGYPVMPNYANFPFMKPDGAGGLYTATAFGDLIHITKFGGVISSNPIKDKSPGRDTPRGPIVDVAVDGTRIYALMGASYRFVQPSGMKVLKTVDNFATFTDYSAQAVDGTYTAVVAISSLDTLANGDALLIGFDDKFVAAQFFMTALNGNTANMQGDLSQGGLAWAGTLDLNAGTGGLLDSTLSHSGTNMITMDRTRGYVALIPKETAGLFSSWATDTYGGFTKYWLRLTFSAALDASTSIAEVHIAILRPAPDFSPTTFKNSAALEASGGLMKVLSGDVTGETIVWDDVYTLHSPSAEGKMCVTTVPLPMSGKGSLAVYSRYSWSLLPLLPNDEIALAPYPVSARNTAGKVTANPLFYPSAVDLQAPYRLRHIECFAENMTEGVDTQGACWHWGETNPWSVALTSKSNYAVFDVDDNEGGRVLHTAYQMLDSVTTDPIGPSTREFWVWVEPMVRSDGNPVPQTRSQPEVA